MPCSPAASLEKQSSICDAPSHAGPAQPSPTCRKSLMLILPGTDDYTTNEAVVAIAPEFRGQRPFPFRANHDK
jgi:hypothetical protein